MVQRAGIPGLPHFINAVMILAALSVSNANLHLTVTCFIDSLTDRVDVFMHWRVSAKLRSASPERIAMVSQSGVWYSRHCQERWRTSRFA
jgi:L-asparagine transporter-like permease